MFCTQCGSPQPQDASFCAKCGHTQSDQTGSGPLAPPVQPDNSAGLAYAPIKTYLAESIIVTILCCWPIGIPAIVYAARATGAAGAGRRADAEEAALEARKWVIRAVIAGVVVIIGYMINVVIAQTSRSAASP